MAQNYGNSYGIKDFPKVEVSTINVWHRIKNRIPVGLVLAVSDEYPAGSVIKAGTPASGTEIGGAATVGAAADMTLPYSGLVEKDTVMGPKCCTLSVIDEGELLIDRVFATISESQKTALKNNIKFLTQYTDKA